MEKRLPKGTLGGQAVIEGVMMKGKDNYSVAVRKPDKKIEVKLEEYKSVGDKYILGRIPFIRGIVNFTESLVLGMKTLTYSSSFYEEEEETKADKLFKDIFKEKAENVIIGFTVLISVCIAIALFMMLPAVLAEFVGTWVRNRILLSFIEGMIRLIIFIIYVLLISQMEDIKRVFMYHGAEHKTINCYEAGEELTPENVAKHSRYHKRCGTSFLFIVMVVSIFVFMFITADKMWLRFVLRLLLIPFIAGISYEFIRLAGRNDNIFLHILSKPGMWIQKLTTKEPGEEMIQVAIISVESVLYGQQYVDAVNEAQGLGKYKPKEEAEITEEAKTEAAEIKEVSEYEEVEADEKFEYKEVEADEEFEYEEVEADEKFEYEEVEADEEFEYEEVEADEAFEYEAVENEEAEFEEAETDNEAEAKEEVEDETDKESESDKEEAVKKVEAKKTLQAQADDESEADDNSTNDAKTEKTVADSEDEKSFEEKTEE